LIFTNIPIIHELEQTFALAFRAYKEAVNSNLIEIRKKYQNPSQIVGNHSIFRLDISC